MLTQIRERASGWLAWVVIVLISIPFALWGIESYFENPVDAAVATVNGEEISLYEYQNELSRRRQASRATDLAELRKTVVNDLIQEMLMEQYVVERNYQISDELLQENITSNTAFLTDGVFDPDLYQNLLRRNGYTPQSFEFITRKSVAINQLNRALNDTAFATESEISRLAEFSGQTREADYALIKSAGFSDTIKIEDADIEKRYRENEDSYRSQARMKIDYIDLSVVKLTEQINLSEDEIAAAYQQNIEKYKQAESRKASHILFSADGDDADADKQAKADAEKILAQAKAGEDFADLAKQHSDDPGSKQNGGDLGVVARGQMVAPFEQAVFDMQQDEIRGPVKTQFGYHIIKLTELKQERQKTLDEVRADVVAELKKQQAEDRFAELGEEFENLVFEEPDNLTAAAERLNLTVETSDWFTQTSGEGVAALGEIRSAAFSDEVLKDNLNSEAIVLGFDRLVAVRKAEHEASELQSLEAVREDIIQTIKTEKSAAATKELGEKLVVELKDAKQKSIWDTLIKREKLESQTLNGKRSEIVPEMHSLADAVFAAELPKDGKPVYGGAAVANGDYAIFALRAIGAAADEQTRATLRSQVTSRDGNEIYQQLRDTYRKQSSVNINTTQLENQRRELNY